MSLLKFCLNCNVSSMSCAKHPLTTLRSAVINSFRFAFTIALMAYCRQQSTLEDSSGCITMLLTPSIIAKVVGIDMKMLLTQSAVRAFTNRQKSKVRQSCDLMHLSESDNICSRHERSANSECVRSLT